MAKSKEELDALKLEVETLNSKLQQLNEDEFKYVSGGNVIQDESTDKMWMEIKKPAIDTDNGLWGDSIRPKN